MRNMAIRHSSHSILFILMMQWRCSKVHRLSLLLKIKKLATQIIQTYNTIKTAYGSFGAFMDIKLKCIEKLTDKAEVREALAKNKLRTKMQEWDFYFTIPEGVQAVQQISYIHSYPRKMYGRYMEQIDETLAAIDEVYK